MHNNTGLTINFFNLNLRDPAVQSKFGAVYQSFFNALVEQGCNVVYSDDVPSAEADVLIVPMGGGQEYSSLQAINCFTGPVILYVPAADSWFDQRLLDGLSEKVLFAYGPDVSTFSHTHYAKIGMPYYYFPFASDPSVMRPLNLNRHYDVVFVGSLAHAPRRLSFLEPLIKAVGQKSFLFVGSGGQEYGFPEQLIAWGALLNLIYNLSCVCVNIHTSSQVKGKNLQVHLNNRVFDLAMAGCCQVCDNSEAVKLCFDEDEVICAKTPSEWVDQVLFMLAHPEVAESFRRKAFETCLYLFADHLHSPYARILLLI